MEQATIRERAGARSTDLRPRDWLEAGQSLLRRGGLRALKLRPLAAELRVSTGSFYHHFTDFDAFQRQLSGYFAGDQIAELIDAVSRASPDPVGRIRLLAELVVRRGLSRLSIAMRAWAESDAHARMAVERHDAQLLAFLSACLRANGLDPQDAMVRSYALVALGFGKVHAPGLDRATLMDELLTLLCQPNDHKTVATTAQERPCRRRATTISS